MKFICNISRTILEKNSLDCNFKLGTIRCTTAYSELISTDLCYERFEHKYLQHVHCELGIVAERRLALAEGAA
jgi:hypothetical protein